MWFQSLMSFAKNIPSRFILLSIVLFGFALRVNNLTIGFPILLISNDEAIYYLSPLNMLAERTPFVLGNYGPLGSYIQIPFLAIGFLIHFISGKVDSISEMEFLLVTQEGYFMFIPRVISATFGTLSIIASYFLSKQLFKDKNAALWTSFFFAVSFNLVHVSHLARSWSPAIFFSLLSVIFVIKSTEQKLNEWRNILLSFLFAAISFGFHQISGLVIILVVLIRVLGTMKVSRMLNLKNFTGISLWLFLVLILNFLSVGGNFLRIVDPANPNVGLFKAPDNSRGIFDVVLFYINQGFWRKVPVDLFLTDGIIAGLFLMFATKKEYLKRTHLPFYIFIGFNFFLISFVLPPFLRYFLIGLSFLPVFAGYVVSKSIEGKKPFVLIPTLILVFSLSSFNSIYWNILISRKPTFMQVREWLDKNIAAETPIAYTIRRNFGYVPTASASLAIRNEKPDFFKRAVALVGDSYPYNVRNILYMDEFGGSKEENLIRAMEAYPVDYVIDSYLGAYDRLLNNDNQSFNLFLIAHFSPTEGKVLEGKIPETLFDAPYNFPLFVVDRAGPYFDVLKVER